MPRKDTDTVPVIHSSLTLQPSSIDPTSSWKQIENEPIKGSHIFLINKISLLASL